MPDPLYVRARAALLDAVEALDAHLNAIVLVGAQAIYLHTGDTELAVAEYTTDADFTVSPTDLADAPVLGDLLAAHGFTPREHPDGWLSRDGVYVDLMVPETLAGPGRRGARLGPHGARVARRAKGLEAALVDRERHTVGALDQDDPRTVELWVAGPGALLVAKVHKITDRADVPDRLSDKDALDVLRIVRAVETDDLAMRLNALARSRAAAVTREAVARMRTLFAASDAAGVAMAVRAGGAAEDAATVLASFAALIDDLLAALEPP